jgi:hypothetical protein
MAGRRLEFGPFTWTGGEHSPAFRFGHALAEDPMLGLEAIALLADRLRPDLIETAASDRGRVEAAFRPVKWSGPGASSAVREVAERRLWVAISSIEEDPAYRTWLGELFEEFRTAAGIAASAVGQPEGYLFVSAANTTVPFHVDHENNLFFQARGRKHFTVGSFADDASKSTVFEGMYSGEYGAVDQEPVDLVTHELQPGSGLFIGPDCVHSVVTEGELSISLSVVWGTPVLQRYAKVYAVNHHLRRLGLHPRSPGRSTVIDAGKAAAATAWRGVRSLTERRPHSG